MGVKGKLYLTIKYQLTHGEGIVNRETAFGNHIINVVNPRGSHH